jgi:hypothetical protein
MAVGRLWDELRQRQLWREQTSRFDKSAAISDPKKAFSPSQFLTEKWHQNFRSVRFAAYSGSGIIGGMPALITRGGIASHRLIELATAWHLQAMKTPPTGILLWV